MKKNVSLILAFILIFSLLIPFAISASAANTDVLKGKTVLVVGDDISAGWNDVSRGYGGWGKRLNLNYGMKTTLVHQTRGVTISDWRKGVSGVIYKQINSGTRKSYDYILLHGGMADAEKSDSSVANALEGVAVGAVKQGDYSIPYDYSTMSAATFADGMERLIINAVKKYSGARIGFIINYATPNNSCENARDMERYWSIARQVCEKWGVPYLDLYAGKTADGKSYSYDILDMDNAKSPNHGNGKHLKAAGYDVITPYIAEWMTTIQPYDLEKAMATAPTTSRKTGKTLPTTTTTTSKAPAGNTTTSASIVGQTTTSTPSTTSTGNKGGIVAAGDGEVVTRKTSGTTTTMAAKDDSTGMNDTVTLVLIICISLVVLIVVGIITTLVIRAKKK